ncbi:hypothetical protein [Sporosarcina sp. BI001-red]|uniref:hypothetical protein n=1 Tax=Sporosarcina sp. BI001-red TaxID=2282866 RepID=UPI0011C04AA9|nr:hypothetical protein [Sporosarcina sp. BI001-red]
MSTLWSGVKDGDSGGTSESEALGASGRDALISANSAEIRQSERFVVRLAEIEPLGKRPSVTKRNIVINELLFQRRNWNGL